MTMTWPVYREQLEQIPYTEGMEYQQAIMWLHPWFLPMGAISLGEQIPEVVRVPATIRNRYGNTVPVIAISKDLFAGKTQIREIILPSSIERIPAGAFAGCSRLTRITIPRRIRSIGKGTFAGCKNLTDVFYEGSMEEWNRIRIVHYAHDITFGDLIPGTPVQQITSETMRYIPGNEALFTSNLHFGCNLESEMAHSYTLSIGGKDITDYFRTM